MERTLAWLRDHGYQPAKTEHFNHWAKVRQDLFGFIDVLAVKNDHMIAIQCSDDEHHAAHRNKILANPVAPILAQHMDVEIWSWGLKLTGRRRKDGLLNRQKEQTLRRDSLTDALKARGLPS
jgi:hypothetical protein